MGWASANSIFDTTARALLDQDVDAQAVTRVLAALILELRDMDWDTLDESIDRFGDHPSIMAAFHEAVPDYFEDDDAEDES